jgi:magnesium transporter
MTTLKIKPGAARGLTPHATEAPQADFPVNVITFDKDQLTETRMSLNDVAAPDPGDPRVSWVRVMSMPDAPSLAHFGARWGLDPLDLEDVIDLGRRAKTEIRGNSAFTLLQIPALDESNSMELRQVSLFLGPNYVISIVQGGDPVFDLVAARVRTGGVTGRIRSSGAEYLFNALVTATVDHGHPVIDALGRVVDGLEESLLEGESQDSLDPIHGLRRELNVLRRSQWPAREAIEKLIRSEDSPLSKRARTLLRDSLDAQVQINEQIEGLKEDVMGLQDLHLSLQGHRLNEVMRVLTIIATIFIPLSFFTGLYGMNFDPDASPWNMPELDSRYGYPALLAFLALLVIGMIVYFRRRKWL